jgi:nitroreductase
MAEIEQNALRHRSIRRYANAPLTQTQLDELVAVAQATASSKFMQQFSLIHVTDPALRQQIAAVTTYDYAADNGDLFIFALDQARNVALVQDSGKSIHQLTNWDALLGGIFDSTLAAQNMTAAAERSGLGAVYLGSILNDPQAMIDLLHLPKYTFPILGMMIGTPAEDPDLKPRLPRQLVYADNAYPELDDTVLQQYDEHLRHYYQTRKWGQKNVSYTESMVKHLAGSLHHRDDIGRILHQQGFELPEE